MVKCCQLTFFILTMVARAATIFLNGRNSTCFTFWNMSDARGCSFFLQAFCMALGEPFDAAAQMGHRIVVLFEDDWIVTVCTTEHSNYTSCSSCPGGERVGLMRH